MDILDEYDIRATVALNADVCEHEPEIVDAGMDRDWEFMGHGETNSRPLSGLDEPDERAVIRNTKTRIEAATGVAPRGWVGPARAETFNTPRLLVEEGFEYLGDFVNDDQPYEMTTDAGTLYSIPYSTEINDIGLLTSYNMSGPEFAACLTDQFDVLYEEGKEPGNGKVMAISLHPYLTGLPYRSKYLDQALEYITGHPDVWLATGSEIIDHYKQQLE
jgi:peptidoglycan/xylan/chitin deacetylase (PgdA/CDA1 family)